MRAARGGDGESNNMGGGGSGYEPVDDLVQCPTCGRKFNENAAKSHLPFCANKAKMNRNNVKKGKR